MKIPAYKIDGYIATLNPTLKAVLLYGPDVGLCSERAAIISGQVVEDPADPFRIAEINADVLKDTPSLLADEAASISFGGGKRLIKVRDAGNASTVSVKQALEEERFKPEDALILVLAGELPPGSSLRKYFEMAKNAAAIPCYNDDAASLPPIIIQTLKKNGFSIEREAVRLLAENCQGDRLIVRRELEKLMLYMGEQKAIAVDDIHRSIGMTTESTQDDICIAVANGDFASLQRHLDKAYRQGSEPIALLRASQRYFMRLYEARGMAQAGKTPEQAMQSLKPSVFFKQAPSFLRHMSMLGPAAVGKAIETLQRAELACKQTGSIPGTLTARALMEVANLSRKQTRQAA